MTENSSTAVPHQWRFFRAGGFDQVLLDTAEDLLALDQLDKKLWSALSCPVNGVEFDRRTLELIDTDHDGHIRVAEIVAAAAWAGGCLRDRSFLVSGREELPLAAIDGASEAGGRVLAAARTMLDNLGRTDAVVMSLDDVARSEESMSRTRFNGDGVITPASTDDEELVCWVTAIIDCCGGVPDRSGEAGIGRVQLEQFSDEAAAALEWWDNPVVKAGVGIDEDMREEALSLWEQLAPKIDDYFLRCGMAAYDGRAEALMNGSEEQLVLLAARNLTEARDDMASLPLASVSATGGLNLEAGVNPAWREVLQRFRTLVLVPVFGERGAMTMDEWKVVKERFQECRAWWEARPATAVAGLGLERIMVWRDRSVAEKLAGLLEQDLRLQPAFEAMVDVERLIRYCRDLLTLANNFVSFREFYSRRGAAIFQAGTLYLDGRSFELCITVDDVARHAVLANQSRLYLAYCDCRRSGGAEKKTIAAAITGGSADQLLVGRNGVFYDRTGQDWDATIVRIIEHPISIRQAFWDPYKRIGTMVGEQIQKIAAARSRAAEEKAAANLMQAGQKKDEKAAQQAFDVGKFAGIFAAIGLAVGAIGTAIASILTGFFKLPWWQMPLALGGIVLLISGPSVLIALFKLRQRNLGRLLDANGWAVNTRAVINIPFGASLTSLAALPPGASRALNDPFAEQKSPWRWLAPLLMGLVLAGVVVWKLGMIR